ncbi:hypothetical protein [Halomicrococcus sp. NG-SE-24]|uniref:hypothetical protein n=1 Tax=Halomicrococcus sp. NG-SE-24 TaxID=3436928 RepID=UPI003D9941C0
MVYKVDYRDGDVLRWSLTDDGAEYAVDDGYAPTLYVSAHDDGTLADVRSPTTPATRPRKDRSARSFDTAPGVIEDIL